MSVMSVGKKPKALVRPLGAGNSRAGAHRGELRSGEPGAAAHRSEKRNVPGVSVAAQPGITGPARPRAARQHPPARPRLWVVPDAAVPDAGRARPRWARPRWARRGRPQCRRAKRRRAPAEGGTRRADPGPAAQHQAGRGAFADACGPARIGAVPGACPAGAADQADPARAPGGLGIRGSPPRRGDHPGPARPGVRGAGGQSRSAAVCGAGQHAADRGQARPVPVVDRAERGAPG